MDIELPRNLHAFIIRFLRPYKYFVGLYISIALLAGCWGPFNSLLIKQLINLISESNNPDLSQLAWTALFMVLNFTIFDNLTWRSISYLNYKFRPLIKNRIISETFSFVLGSSNQFFQENLSGRIAAQINTLADNIERILHRIAPDFIRGMALLLIALASTFYVNYMFFYVMLIWFILFSSLSIFLSRKLVFLSDLNTEAESNISGELVDSISNVNSVGIFARKNYEVIKLEKSLFKTKKTFQDKEFFLIALNSIQGLMIAAMLGFMLYFLIKLYALNQVSIGDFALILGLSMEVAHMTWYTMSQVDEFNQSVGKCRQSLNRLIIPQGIKDKENAPDLIVKQGKITFSNVKFHYKGTDPLFQNKSVTIEAGQKIGLVGYSGSGKTTFVNLILRLFELTDGRILIDDQNIADVKQNSLRSNIAMIPQDPSLFHRSIMENIRYGRMEASDEEVITATKKAHAHDFIIKLPLGYNSLVGDRGIKLSGGQRQRIAIARAILKNAPILILDEATSQLDSMTENDIQESLWRLMQGKTTIIIAHRLSTLLRMDRIIVFNKGKIVEDGTHEELLDNNSLYKNLWNTQVGGFLADENGLE